jgi:NAD(P)-dependent dehydrogenase (short-subunit alcohol dehydrogenase family)
MNRLRALVTGGSGAIGSAICRRLAADGRHVLVHAHRHAEAAQALAAELCAQGASAEALAFDVTDAGAARTALEAVLERGPVQILVNNAGVHDDAAFPGMSEAQWHRVIDVSRRCWRMDGGVVLMRKGLHSEAAQTLVYRIVTAGEYVAVARISGSYEGGAFPAAGTVPRDFATRTYLAVERVRVLDIFRAAMSANRQAELVVVANRL